MARFNLKALENMVLETETRLDWKQKSECVREQYRCHIKP
jgi:hypothetical protein